MAKVLVRRHKVEIKQIAVLTPYSAQKNLIEEKMNEANVNVKVASITESQGEHPYSMNHEHLESSLQCDYSSLSQVMSMA